MKHFIAAFFATFLLTCNAYAQHRHYHHYHHHHHRSHSHWIAPALGGIIAGAIIANAASQPQPVIVVPQYSQPVEYYQCLVQVFDPYTNTYRNEVRTCIR